jgi:hypothetical protein
MEADLMGRDARCSESLQPKVIHKAALFEAFKSYLGKRDGLCSNISTRLFQIRESLENLA